MNPLYLLLLAAGGAYALKGRTSKKLQYFPKSFTIQNNQLIFSLDAVNPTQNAIQVNNIFAVIYNGGTMIGRIQYINKIFLKTGTTMLNIPVIPFSGGVTSLVTDTIEGKKPDLHVVGTINAEGVMFPLNEKLSLT